jgi:excisionase family DNA binding protein
MSKGTMHSVADVAQRLNVSRKTILRLIQKKELRAFRVGRQLRIPELAITEMLHSTRFSDEDFQQFQTSDSLF